MTVLASMIVLRKSSRVLGPISRPIQPSGMQQESTILFSASGAYAVATTLSIGSRKFTPLASAFAMISLASSMLSASSKDVPISRPCALKKVYAMPPPMIRESHLSRRFVMTPILSETFAPPRIATNGRSGSSSALPMKPSSLPIKKPATAGR